MTYSLADYLREQQHTYITAEQADAIASDIELLFPFQGRIWASPAEPVEKSFPWYSRWTKTMLSRSTNKRLYGSYEGVRSPKYLEAIAMMEEIRNHRERI